MSASRGFEEISTPAALAPAPLVSVLMLAYNQQDLLPQAIDSILAQRTSFPLEIVIGEDGSRDGTLAVARRYQEAHPSLIRIIASSPNAGMQQNFRRVIEASRGEFLAICEGDDYWTDPAKLERQLAVFRARPEVALVFHSAALLDHARQEITGHLRTGPVPRDYTLEEVILGGGGMMPTASIVVRRDAMPPMEAWFLDCSAGDYPLALWAASRGICHSLPEVMSVYRQNLGASWTAQGGASAEVDWRQSMRMIRMLDAFPAVANRPEAHPPVRRMIRLLLRDVQAAHGGEALEGLPGRRDFEHLLTWKDRALLFWFPRRRSLRMRLAWRAITLRRRLFPREGLATTPPS